MSNLKDNTKPLTPWGYPQQNKTPASDQKSNASAASWQTIRAGLLSPPPLSSSLLLSPPPNAVAEEDFENEAPLTFEPAHSAAAGPGGWLVDLVEGMQGIELLKLPHAAPAAAAKAA